jgi:hypothetical protein
MSKSLIVILILASAAAGCVSRSGSGSGANRTGAFNLDPDRSRSCYGGPVYQPC